MCYSGQQMMRSSLQMLQRTTDGGRASRTWKEKIMHELVLCRL